MDRFLCERGPGLGRNQRVRRCKLLAAREFRKNMTRYERILWEHLRKRQLGGYKFRRQQVIDGYIVDFYCHESRVVIEVDGPVHDNPEKIVSDQTRTKVFQEKYGLAVVRVTNNAVVNHLRNTLDLILSACNNPPDPLLSKERDAVRSAAG